MQLLIVEDNLEIGENIKEYLELEWYVVYREKDGLAGFKTSHEHQFDVILLDVMLPGMDGFTLCQKIRERSKVPIIMTTAKWQLDDKEEWFDWGADDYLVKPFALKELALRIKALLKRTEVSDIFSWGDIEVDLEDNKVTKLGKEIKLSLKEFQILAVLIDGWGHMVSRATIIDIVWWWDALWENDGKLDVYISTLRKKLWKGMIETMKGYGYRIDGH